MKNGEKITENTEGCLICGKQIDYYDDAINKACHICGEDFQTNAVCSGGHFVCDSCHQKKGFEEIKDVFYSTKKTNPIEIAEEMFLKKSIHMHGPEHHFLVAAALLAAYVNSTQSDINNLIGIKSDIIDKAEKRAVLVPGGICGFWGSCGAAIGAGIFISIISGATPMTVDSWSKANLAVSTVLKKISENGGPRCCKRNTYIAITSATDFLEKYMNMHLELPDNIQCVHNNRNQECKRNACKYYNQRTEN